MGLCYKGRVYVIWPEPWARTI